MYREDTRRRTEDRYKEDLALYTECIMILTGENIDPPLLKTVSDLSRNSGIIEHASNLSNKIKKNIFSADLVTFCRLRVPVLSPLAEVPVRHVGLGCDVYATREC